MVTYWQITGIPWGQYTMITTLQFVYDALCLLSTWLTTNKEYRRWEKSKKKNKNRKHYCKRFYIYGKHKMTTHVRLKTSRTTKANFKQNRIMGLLQIPYYQNFWDQKLDQKHKRIATFRKTCVRRSAYVCISQNTDLQSEQQQMTDSTVCCTYDTDSYWIGVDTMSSYCITNSMMDFIGKPKQIKLRVRGVSQQLANITYVGTGQYSVLDNTGKRHDLSIPVLYYCSTMPFRILSPQHLGQLWEKQRIGRLFETTNATATKLIWSYQNNNDKVYQKTILHHINSKVPLMKSAPGFRNYITKTTRNSEWYRDDTVLVTMTTQKGEVGNQVVENDVTQQQLLFSDDAQVTQAPDGDTTLETIRNQPIEVEFHDELMPKNDNKELVDMDPKLEMLLWHYRLGHMPFSAMK